MKTQFGRLWRSNIYQLFLIFESDKVTFNMDDFCNLQLNKVNYLALGSRLSHPVLSCDVKLTPARLRMLTALFHPTEFGGKYSGSISSKNAAVVAGA